MSKVQRLQEAVVKMKKATQSVTEKMVGNHLLYIVGGSEELAAIVLEDFAAGKTLKDLDRAVEKAATKAGNRAVCGPEESTKAICNELGLPVPQWLATGIEPVQPAASAAEPVEENTIDFLSLLEV